MSTGETAGPIHPVPTGRSGHRDMFYTKHPGQGGFDATQWLPDFSQDNEFAIFDTTDFHDISDDRDWPYGVEISQDGKVLYLGTSGQQLAEFPFSRRNNLGMATNTGR